jgi:hypothetical protein
MLLKVKSERRLKYAIELIYEMMAKFGLERYDSEIIDYHMPFETTEELAKRDLVKVILPAGVKLDKNANVVKLDVGELLEAVNSDKEHIKLTKDIEDVVPDDELPTKHRLVFDGGKNYLFDLNGYTLKVINHANEYYTGKVPMISVSGTSTLEIKDGSLGFDNWYAGNDRKARGVVHVADTSTLVATKVNMQNKYAGNVVSATADAHVTLDGGEYTVQNGFAIYLDRQASLTLDGDVSIKTVVGDSANTQHVDGYGALYSESTGELIVNYAFFKSGIQVSKSQIGAFSTANHEVTINGKVLTEDIFVGTSTEAKNQNKEYFS